MTDLELYTDEDFVAAKAAYDEKYAHWAGPGEMLTAALDRIAPAVAAKALKRLARVCFDEGDAGVIVGGIEVVEMYVFDTIAELTGDPADQANAEKMREIAGRSLAEKAVHMITEEAGGR